MVTGQGLGHPSAGSPQVPAHSQRRRKAALKCAQATGSQEGVIFKKRPLFAICLSQFCLVSLPLLWVPEREVKQGSQS